MLCFGRLDFSLQFGGEFALFFDRSQNCLTPLFKFAQVDQAFFERTQLRIVQTASDFLTIARDERHGRTFVKQLDGGHHLRGFDVKFAGDLFFDDEWHRNE